MANSDLSKALAKKETNKVALKQKNDIFSKLERQATEYQIAMAGDSKKAERFVRILKTAIKSNPKLLECNPLSVLGATMEMAQLDLDPMLNEGWLVPYSGNATFQLGIRGIEKLFYRALPDAILEAHVVYSIDHFKYSFGANRVLEHVPYANEEIVDGEPYITFVYAIARMANGQFKFEVMSRKAIEQHRDRFSKQYISAKRYNKEQSTIWHKNFEEMAKNTVIRKLLKNMPKSVELESAMRDHEQVKMIKDVNEVDASYNILDQLPEPENQQDEVIVPENKEIKDKPARKKKQQKAKEPDSKKKKTDDIEEAEIIDDKPNNSDTPFDKPDDGEVKMTAEDYHKLIYATYATLQKEYSKDLYPNSFFTKFNQEKLGVDKVSGCVDIDKLKYAYDVIFKELENNRKAQEQGE